MLNKEPRKDGRGGRRKRRFQKPQSLGEIDRKVLATLLEKLGPRETSSQRESALKIVVKGIEIYRECAPRGSALTGTVQKNRRALEKLKKGKTETGQLPFNSFARVGKTLYGAASNGLYRIEDVPGRSAESYGDLESAIAGPLRTLAVIQQLAAGFRNVDPNIPFNGIVNVGTNGEQITTGDVLLNDLAKPQDREAELAGYCYLALARGLEKRVVLTQPKHHPKRSGFNYWQLLRLALIQAGVPLPNEELHSNPVRLERLMKAGEESAARMLAPAITHADGRTFSDFEMTFSET
ncbi:hypothetical protein CSC74_03120 [Pseudoxanthomonas yeongjuensis]|uniref:hypothetical protein n=1 Tax=Pseudoxanthomonas yeongjuensis TaxID=377616 RepID=UPI001391D3B3|nr:hypothetical protein [Pseudoxanthomonas yeongjuensis]KAF1717912.1 hypothetical protein CSC74_03120 [Pseudoxanthomonas yeongjuensis]